MNSCPREPPPASLCTLFCGPFLSFGIKMSFKLTVCVCVRLFTSVMANSSQPHGPAHQAPPSTGLPRQEYWNGAPWPPPGKLYICPIHSSFCLTWGNSPFFSDGTKPHP